MAHSKIEMLRKGLDEVGDEFTVREVHSKIVHISRYYALTSMEICHLLRQIPGIKMKEKRIVRGAISFDLVNVYCKLY